MENRIKKLINKRSYGSGVKRITRESASENVHGEKYLVDKVGKICPLIGSMCGYET